MQNVYVLDKGDGLGLQNVYVLDKGEGLGLGNSGFSLFLQPGWLVCIANIRSDCRQENIDFGTNPRCVGPGAQRSVRQSPIRRILLIRSVIFSVKDLGQYIYDLLFLLYFPTTI